MASHFFNDNKDLAMFSELEEQSLFQSTTKEENLK